MTTTTTTKRPNMGNVLNACYYALDARNKKYAHGIPLSEVEAERAIGDKVKRVITEQATKRIKKHIPKRIFFNLCVMFDLAMERGYTEVTIDGLYEQERDIKHISKVLASLDTPIVHIKHVPHLYELHYTDKDREEIFNHYRLYEKYLTEFGYKVKEKDKPSSYIDLSYGENYGKLHDAIETVLVR